MRNFLKSARYASRGLMSVFAEERNFRIQVAAALVVIIGMILWRLRTWEQTTLILVILVVLVLELINSILERFVDMVQPRLHVQAQAVKDIMAGAVFLASLAACAIAALIFLPHIFG